MRLPWPAVSGGVVAVALGAAGLIAAAVPQSSGAAPTTSSGPGAVTIADAYVRVPVPPGKEAAAYFTVYNTTSQPDRITSVQTGAGATAELHSASMQELSGATVPAHGKLALRTGGMHVMIGQLFGKLVAGQFVNIDVNFVHAGAIDVVAKVIPYGATPPGGN